MRVAIVSDSLKLVEDVRKGLSGTKYEVHQVCMTPEDFRALLNTNVFGDDEFVLIIDTYVGIPVPLEGGEYRLTDESPAMMLLGATQLACPRSYRLAIAHGGSLNDGQMAQKAGAHHFLSCSVDDWMVVLSNHIDIILTAFGLKKETNAA